MTIRMVSRRRLLATVGSAAVATGVDGIARPYLSRAADRPVISHGIQSGDVASDSAKPKLAKVLESPGGKAELGAPHTAYALPGRMLISFLGSKTRLGR